jgi:hypothetical protein
LLLEWHVSLSWNTATKWLSTLNRKSHLKRLSSKLSNPSRKQCRCPQCEELNFIYFKHSLNLIRILSSFGSQK